MQWRYAYRVRASLRRMAVRPDPEGTTEVNTRPNIVLVHGAGADGSSWSGVIERLQADGYHVTAPQFPLTSLADDVARLRHVLALQDGPTVIAGHSYGGQVMTALGTDAPNVVGLVYIAAFGLDEGESLEGLLAQGHPTPALAHQVVDDEGFAWLAEDAFVNYFPGGDIDPVKSRVLYAVQQPLAVSAFSDVMFSGLPRLTISPISRVTKLMTRSSRGSSHSLQARMLCARNAPRGRCRGRYDLGAAACAAYRSA